MLAIENHTVFSYGQELYFLNQKQDNVKVCDNMEECVSASDLIISGIPISKDNITISSPYSEKIIRLDFLKEKLNGKTLIAGVIPEWFTNEENVDNKTSREEKFRTIDLMNIEPFNILNAIPTVEGAIKIAIEETESTIHESNVLILGHGRIGKILCDRFQKMGANVYCAARKDLDFAWIREKRCVCVEYKELPELANNIDIIINTVPHIVINEKILKKLKQNCIIIELASKPGGVDKKANEMYKIRVITALGIPGKIAPRTAAKYIKDTIEKISK